MRTATVDGRLIKRAREMRGLTQAELAAQSGGISHTHISHIESRRDQPSAPVFAAIVKALGVPRETLLVQEEAA